MTEKPLTVAVTQTAERRILGLDGLRGVACITVIISHFFGELAHGVRAAMVGWAAVDIFFVLSGFLIGRLILDKKHHTNFFVVFYMRRACRLLPAYLVTIAAVFSLITLLPYAWVDADQRFPFLSYLGFAQVFWMVSTNSIGAHWLAPTWTLAVEEHFYMLVPALIVFTPRRWLAPTLGVIGAGAIAMRLAACFQGPKFAMAALVLLPGRADLLVLGLLAALFNGWNAVDWPRIMPALRIAPIAGLLLAAFCNLASENLFHTLGPTLVGFSCATFILCIVRGTPEAERFNSPILRYLGDNAYCLYLSHLAVLGLMHGLILGRRPDLQTPGQWAVTILALPVCLVVGRVMTKYIEEPFMAFGRRWRWDSEPRAKAPAAIFRDDVASGG